MDDDVNDIDQTAGNVGGAGDVGGGICGVKSTCNGTSATYHHMHRPAHESFADPATPDWVLSALPILDADSYLAAAAHPNPPVELADRILRTALHKPQLPRYRADDPLISRENWMIAAIRSPAATPATLRHLAINTAICCPDPAPVLDQLLASPHCTDDALIALLTHLPTSQQPSRPRSAKPPSQVRDQLLATLAEAGHPVAAAWQVAAHDPAARTNGTLSELTARIRTMTPVAIAAATTLSTTWCGPLLQLLDAADAATTDAQLPDAAPTQATLRHTDMTTPSKP